MIIQSTQVARSTPFDNDTNGFISKDTQSAIEEVRAIIGYPRRWIRADETVTVQEYESWTIYQQIDIFNTGTLTVLGEVYIVD